MASHADSGAPEQCQLCGAACYTIMSKMVTHVMLAAPATRYRRDPHAITHYGVRGSRLHSYCITAEAESLVFSRRYDVPARTCALFYD